MGDGLKGDLRVIRPKRSTLPKEESEQELMFDKILNQINYRFSMLESSMNEIKKGMVEIREILTVFGFKFEKTKKLAEVAMRYREKQRDRNRRFKKRHGGKK